MPLTLLAWEPPLLMPAHTRMSGAIVKELMSVEGVVDACGGLNLCTTTVDEWPDAVIQILRAERDVLGLTGQVRLLEADAEASETVVQPSTVRHAGLGVFATRDFEVGHHFLPFFGQLVYHDLQVPGRSLRERSYAHQYGLGKLDKSLATTARNWMYTALQLRTHTSMWPVGSSGSSSSMVPAALSAREDAATTAKPVWVAPSEFCAGGRVNDHRPDLVANAKYVQLVDPVMNIGQLILPNCAFLEVTRKIYAGQEVLAKYGRRYPLSSVASLPQPARAPANGGPASGGEEGGAGAGGGEGDVIMIDD